MNGLAAIVFKPGMCSDDGRAITGWWDVYIKTDLKAYYWNEPRLFNTEKEAIEWCNQQNYKIENVSWT